MVRLFVGTSGIQSEDAWRDSMKGSHRMYGGQDVQLLDDFLHRVNAPTGGFVMEVGVRL